ALHLADISGSIAPYRAWQSAARGVDRVPDCSDGVRVGPSNAALDLAHLDVADADRCGQLAQAHAGGCAPVADRRAGEAIRTGRIRLAPFRGFRRREAVHDLAGKAGRFRDGHSFGDQLRTQAATHIAPRRTIWR